MELIYLILGLALLGLLVWAIETYIPMSPPFKTVIRVVVVIAVILYLVHRFSGYLPSF